MPSNYSKAKGRGNGGGRFFRLPKAVHCSPNYPKLSGKAGKLIMDIGIQYNGRNNGDLCAALSVLKKHGWTSSDSLTRARLELLHYGFLEITRQGGRNQCSLYALTWQPIDDCMGKLDIQPTRMSSDLWKEDKLKFRYEPKKRNAIKQNNLRLVSREI